MKKLKIWPILLVLFLTACGSSPSLDSLVVDPMDVNKVQIYYNPIEKTLVKFNPNGNSKEIINKNESTKTYDIYGAGNYFINGDEKTHKYSLLKIEGEDIDHLHDFEIGQEIIPLGYMAGNIYFIQKFYDNDKEDRSKTTISLSLIHI